MNKFKWQWIMMHVSISIIARQRLTLYEMENDIILKVRVLFNMLNNFFTDHDQITHSDVSSR